MEAQTLALYLGCDYYVFPDETITSGWLKVQLEHHPNLRYKYPLTLSNIQKVQEDGYKLLLRPLSSITEDEVKELKLDLVQELVVKDFKKYTPNFNRFTPIQIKDFLSKGFDLFGLIEKNEAIDSTKL